MFSRMNKVLQTVDNFWTKDKIIRYLYVKLAPYFQRDLEYFLADEETQVRMYKENFKQNSHLVVCKTICEQYQQIFEEFGIESKVIQTNNKIVPHFAMIVHGECGWYFIDPLKDLFANQLGLKTSFFGVKPVKYADITKMYPYVINLPESYVLDLDRELNFLYQDCYMDNFFEMLHFEITNNKIYKYFGLEKNDHYGIMKKKLEFIEKFLINLGNIPGLFERNTLYQFLLFNCYNKKERKLISASIEKDDTDYKIELKLAEDKNSDNIIIFQEEKEEGIYSLKRII